MTIPLSPARGDYWESGTQGQPPSGIRGALIVTPDGKEFQLVRNVMISVLAGCRLCEYQSATAAAFAFNVQYTSGHRVKRLAGVVDPLYANKGRTVPRGALFWVQKRGLSHVLSNGTGIAAGEPLVSSVGSGTSRGTAKDISTGQSNLVAMGSLVGVAMQTQPSTLKSTLTYLTMQ